MLFPLSGFEIIDVFIVIVTLDVSSIRTHRCGRSVVDYADYVIVIVTDSSETEVVGTTLRECEMMAGQFQGPADRHL